MNNLRLSQTASSAMDLSGFRDTNLKSFSLCGSLSLKELTMSGEVRELQYYVAGRAARKLLPTLDVCRFLLQPPLTLKDIYLVNTVWRLLIPTGPALGTCWPRAKRMWEALFC